MPKKPMEDDEKILKKAEELSYDDEDEEDEDDFEDDDDFEDEDDLDEEDEDDDFEDEEDDLDDEDDDEDDEEFEDDDDDYERGEFEVVELESEEGEHEEFVVLDRLEINGLNYMIMATLEDVENMENMTEDEFKACYQEEGFFHLMREEGDSMIHIDNDEFESIREQLEAKIAELSE